MRRLSPRLLVIVAMTGALAACDRADANGSCADTIDLAATSGERIELCPASTFAIKEPRWRGVAGRLFAGEDGVPNASIRIDRAKPGFGADFRVPATTAVTDQAGSFGPLADAAMHYDVTAVFGAQISVTRGLSFRYFEPSVDAPFPPRTPGVPGQSPGGGSGQSPGGSIDLAPRTTTSFEAHIDVTLAKPLPEGMAVAFFTKGDNAVSVAGDLTQGLTLVSTAFTSNATLHAVAYPASGDLADATLYATAPVTGVANRRGVVALEFGPIEETAFADPSIEVTAPAGFTGASIDVIVAYSRTSRAYLTSLAIGRKRRMPILPDSLYTAYRVIASAPDGRTIDSGIVGFGVRGVTTVDLSQAEPAALVSPAPGATVAPTDPFVAEGKGVFELTLAPAGAGPTIRILTTERSIALPDFTLLGQAPHGQYTWTIRNFPRITIPEGASGRDGRRGQVSGFSPPRTVVFP